MAGDSGHLRRTGARRMAAAVPVTPFGQPPFIIDYLMQAGLFDAWVADCPLWLAGPNAPCNRDLLGTVLLSVPAGHRRDARITALRCDPVNPPLLGLEKVVSEDARAVQRSQLKRHLVRVLNPARAAAYLS